MEDQKVLEKIAYCYYEKFKKMGFSEDKDRDWKYAINAMVHLQKPRDMANAWYRLHEDDYGEFRIFLDDDDEHQ